MNKRQVNYEKNEENYQSKKMRIQCHEIENDEFQISPPLLEEIERDGEEREGEEMERKLESDSSDRRVCIYQFFQNSNEIRHPPSGMLATPLCGTCDSIIDEDEAMVMMRCQFCSHVGCSKCTPQCYICGERFCHHCSLQNYDFPYERTICIDCNCSPPFH